MHEECEHGPHGRLGIRAAPSTRSIDCLDSPSWTCQWREGQEPPKAPDGNAGKRWSEPGCKLRLGESQRIRYSSRSHLETETSPEHPIGGLRSPMTCRHGECIAEYGRECPRNAQLGTARG
eukprot:592853-Pleurochrysis_carterae.AAC.2